MVAIFLVVAMGSHLPPYLQGIELIYLPYPGAVEHLGSPPMITITDEDLVGSPTLGRMIDVAMELELPLREQWFIIWDEAGNAYDVYKRDGGVEISIGMSFDDLKEFKRWYQENLKSCFEYQGTAFCVASWIT